MVHASSTPERHAVPAQRRNRPLRARISSKGQITIPKAVRERLGVKEGDSLEFQFEGERLEVQPIRQRSIMEFYGIFAVDEDIDLEDARRIAWEARVKRIMEKMEEQDRQFEQQGG